MRKRAADDLHSNNAAKVRIVDQCDSTPQELPEALMEELRDLRRAVASLTEKNKSQEQELDALMNEDNKNLERAKEEYSREYKRSLAKDATIADMRRSLSLIQASSGPPQPTKTGSSSAEAPASNRLTPPDINSDQRRQKDLQERHRLEVEGLARKIRELEADIAMRDRTIFDLAVENARLKKAALANRGGETVALHPVDSSGTASLPADASSKSPSQAPPAPSPVVRDSPPTDLVLDLPVIRHKLKKSDLLAQMKIWRDVKQAPNLPDYSLRIPNKPQVIEDIVNLIKRYPDGNVRGQDRA